MSIIDFLARKLAMHMCLAGVEVVRDIIHTVFDDDVVIGDPEDESPRVTGSANEESK